VTYSRSLWFGIGLCCILSSPAFAEWGPDVRLTVNDSSSRASLNNAWCVAVSGDTVHAVWFDGREGVFAVYYRSSYDIGETWNAETCLARVSYAEYPCIAVAGGDVHVVWEDYRDGNFEVYHKHSPDGGVTWEDDRRLTVNSAQSWYPSVAASGTNVCVVWEDGRSGYYNIYAKTSTDAGATWSPDTALSAGASMHESPSVAVVDSCIYAAWSGYFANASDIWFRRSTDAGATWEPGVRLVQTIDIASGQPCIAAAGSSVNLVWSDGTYANPEIIQKRSTDRGLSWTDPVRLTNNAGTSQSPSVSARDSLVHLVWEDDRCGLGEIFYLRSTDMGATWEPETRLTDDTASSQFPSVAAGEGAVHVVWQDYRDGNYELYYKREADLTALSATGEVRPVVVLSAMPNPFVSWTRVRGGERERFIVTDALGRRAGECCGARAGEKLEPGVYFLGRADGAGQVLRVLKLR
jgi:hypothetical protein